MIKRYLLLPAVIIMLASCDNSNNNIVQSQQAQIDSAARANAYQQEEINRKKNDSTINAIALAKADSIQKLSRKQNTGGNTQRPADKTATQAPKQP
jgi:hypothetical protein